MEAINKSIASDDGGTTGKLFREPSFSPLIIELAVNGSQRLAFTKAISLLKAGRGDLDLVTAADCA
jgi:hypothetical protein